MLRDLQWFQEREGSYILRGTTEVFVSDPQKLFDLQSESYTFSDKLRIHRAPPEECSSCSS
jgi:hypothetical protein